MERTEWLHHLLEEAQSFSARQRIKLMLSTLAYDENWTDSVIAEIDRNEGPDIRCVLNILTDELRPKTYLETGTRRGWSMCVVGSWQKNATLIGFDAWIKNYAGSPNPGPDLVKWSLKQMGHYGVVEFVTGDTNRTVPERVAAWRGKIQPELILVDGDHSYEGALSDLIHLIPILAPGGVLVIDDLLPPPGIPGHLETVEMTPQWIEQDQVTGAWEQAKMRFPELVYVQSGRVGLAYKEAE